MTQSLALTVDEAAALLGRSRQSVYRAVKGGDLRSVRLGGRICVPRSEIEQWAGGNPCPITAAELRAAVAGLDTAIEAAQRVRAGLTDMAARLERRETS